MKQFVFIVFLFLSLNSLGQNSWLNIGDSSILRVNSDGSLAINPSNLDPSYNKSEDVNHYLNQAGIWVLGEDDSGNFFTSVHHYKGLDSVDFYPGPVDTFTGQAADISKWNTVWANDKTTIDNHRNNFNSSGYAIPADILNWPAQGTDGYSRYLAPFVDYNDNGVYDPENGDYPYVKGDHSIYCIYNDLAFEHKASLGVEIGLEVHMLAYSFDEHPHTVFLEYFLIKRGTRPISNIKVGFFMEGRCGNASDNYAGTDVENNAIYIYNGDDNDEGNFGFNIPYVSAQFLNRPMHSSIAFNNSSEINGIPLLSTDYKNYMNSKWKDSSDLTYGNMGMDVGTATDYIFPGNYFVNEDEWNEELAGNVVGQRNMVGVYENGAFQTGDYVKLDVALSAGNTSPQNSLTIKQIIKNQIASNSDTYQTTTSVNELDKVSLLNIYPNPSANGFTISTEKEIISELLIINSQGVTVLNKLNLNKSKIKCNVSLPAGIYYAVVRTQNHIYTKPLILNR